MDKKQLPDDFKEFIQLLNEHKVQYLLVGGWAVGFYGNPRATKDINFLIATDDENITKLQQALLAFGAPTVENSVFHQISSRRTYSKVMPFSRKVLVSVFIFLLSLTASKVSVSCSTLLFPTDFTRRAVSASGQRIRTTGFFRILRHRPHHSSI